MDGYTAMCAKDNTSPVADAVLTLATPDEPSLTAPEPGDRATATLDS